MAVAAAAPPVVIAIAVPKQADRTAIAFLKHVAGSRDAGGVLLRALDGARLAPAPLSGERGESQTVNITSP